MSTFFAAVVPLPASPTFCLTQKYDHSGEPSSSSLASLLSAAPHKKGERSFIFLSPDSRQPYEAGCGLPGSPLVHIMGSFGFIALGST